MPCVGFLHSLPNEPLTSRTLCDNLVPPVSTQEPPDLYSSSSSSLLLKQETSVATTSPLNHSTSEIAVSPQFSCTQEGTFEKNNFCEGKIMESSATPGKKSVNKSLESANPDQSFSGSNTSNTTSSQTHAVPLISPSSSSSSTTPMPKKDGGEVSSEKSLTKKPVCSTSEMPKDKTVSSPDSSSTVHTPDQAKNAPSVISKEKHDDNARPGGAEQASPATLTTVTPTTSTSTSTIITPGITSAKGKFLARSARPPHQHRLIRQHSLAAVLGLFRSSNRDEVRGVSSEWRTVREESTENHDRSSGNNNSRSFSIPSSSASNLPQRRRVRRSSIHTDFADGTYIIGSVPAVLAVKKKPVDNDPKLTATRRCSLTLPYANLYGSWQRTISPPGVRHAIGDTTMGGSQKPIRKAQPSVEMIQISEKGPLRTNVSQNFVQKQASLCKQTSLTAPSSSDLKTSPSTLPLLLTTSSLEETAEEEENDDSGGGRTKQNVEIWGGFNNRNLVIQLMACTFQKVPMKDFGSEVRATMDIEHFLQTAVLLIDVQETSLEGITDLLLEKVLAHDEPLCSINEARSILFTHDTGKYSLFFL